MISIRMSFMCSMASGFVNDQGHQLGNFGLEGESLDIGLFLDDSVDLWVG